MIGNEKPTYRQVRVQSGVEGMIMAFYVYITAALAVLAAPLVIAKLPTTDEWRRRRKSCANHAR